MLHLFLERQLATAIQSAFPDLQPIPVPVRPCPDPRFGDYQAAGLMAIAKIRRQNPRQLATEVLKHLDVSAWCDSAEVAGAGFINFRLKSSAVAEVLADAGAGRHMFFERTSQPQTFVVDFSSPNAAKPMHVGHIRSTLLGDCVARVLRLLGHRVITDNHLGDWGTQFGKLIVGWKKQLDRAALDADPLAEMERLYKLVNSACESDPALLDEARQELLKLQNADSENLGIWRQMIELSRAAFDAVYARLGTRFDHTLGESFYNDRLRPVVSDLSSKGIARESEGAMVVFFEDPELKDHPAIVQKRDGAANYTTTDLATIEYRLREWQPAEIVYVTDGRQQLHFKQLFAIFRQWHPETVLRLSHVWFGSILGEDGKPFRTRAGETVKLNDLLDEAEERTFQIVSEKNPYLSEEDRREIARIVGIGAVKYADLLPNRQSDYVFSWEKMLSLQGNTAPYLQYAYTRIRSIFRKGEFEGAADAGPAPALELTHPSEFALSKHLLNFGLVLESVAAEYRPNYLCNYLYDLAGAFTQFYENCPVLKAQPVERATRLALCALTAAVLRLGLEVLGIETPEKM